MRPLRQRFEAKVEKTENCWFWTACKLPTGYGQIKVNGTAALAHRVSYELHVGPIPDGLQLDHLCRERSCVNPAHLEPVTIGENLHRGLLGDLKETCANGHPWIPENICSNGTKGYRCCGICKREREKRGPARKNLLPHLTTAEQARAVLEAGSIESARRKLCPSAFDRAIELAQQHSKGETDA